MRSFWVDCVIQPFDIPDFKKRIAFVQREFILDVSELEEGVCLLMDGLILRSSHDDNYGRQASLKE